VHAEFAPMCMGPEYFSGPALDDAVKL